MSRKITIRISEEAATKLEADAARQTKTVSGLISEMAEKQVAAAAITDAIASLETRMAEREHRTMEAIQRIPQASAAATVEAFAQKKAEEAARAQGGQA